VKKSKKTIFCYSFPCCFILKLLSSATMKVFSSSLTVSVVLVVSSTSTTPCVAVQNGDTCGVSSSDFLTYDFRSDFLVAGEEGCTFGEATNCYCAPDLNDGESLSEWKWQCDNTVIFGPSLPEKVCPESVPVGKGLGSLDVVLNRRALQAQQERISCNTTINPTGRPGDEFCPYSSCDQGGDHSAICACIDLEQYGLGEGMEWICMHATCSCGGSIDEEPVVTEAPNESSSCSFGSLTVSLVFLLVGTAVTMQ
jgi:hypothetical protein